MKTLLLTGASGFLGWNICHFPQTDWQIIGTYHQHLISYPNVITTQLDLKDTSSVHHFFKKHTIDAVLHTAALSQPNSCAQNPELSQKVNVEATTLLAQICQTLDIPFIFTSSSQVFDGENAPYLETDEPKPIHIYAKHKLLAEQQIQAINPKAIIVRMPLMYGNTSPASNNFLKEWLNKMRNGEVLNVFTDEYRMPASGQSAAEGLFLLLKKQVSGVFHLAGKDRLSRADFAYIMQRIFNINGANIQPCLQSDVKMAAKRPKDLSFICDKMIKLGFEPKGVEEELIKILNTSISY
jgi:dTDP-4-dehydrorhamnose reductase